MKILPWRVWQIGAYPLGSYALNTGSKRITEAKRRQCLRINFLNCKRK